MVDIGIKHFVNMGDKEVTVTAEFEATFYWDDIVRIAKKHLKPDTLLTSDNIKEAFRKEDPGIPDDAVWEGIDKGGKVRVIKVTWKEVG